jgi:hypothetical protein
MKIKEFNWFLKLIIPKEFYGITLWPFGIYFRNPEVVNDVDIRHERIHWLQQRETLYIGFYLWYIIEWFIKMILPPKGAYRDLSFEREAYLHETDLDYLTTRKNYSWLKYILK